MRTSISAFIIITIAMSSPGFAADCDAPVVAVNDFVMVSSVVGGLIDPLANDSNSAGHPLEIDNVNPPSDYWGTLDYSNGETIRYSAAFGYSGTFQVTYTAGDATDSSSGTAQLTVTVSLDATPLFGDGFESGDTSAWSEASL